MHLGVGFGVLLFGELADAIVILLHPGIMVKLGVRTHLPNLERVGQEVTRTGDDSTFIISKVLLAIVKFSLVLVSSLNWYFNNLGWREGCCMAGF